VATFPHPAIQLQYKELVVRYYTFFEANQQYIPQTLEHFARFIHHDHVKVRTRSWYLFFRFTKLLKSHVGGVAETILQALGDLLAIKAELPSEDANDDDDASSGNDQSPNATFQSQLHLYEAVGCVSSAPGIPVENQVMFIRSLTGPLISDLEAQYAPAKTGDERALLQAHHVITAMGTLAHGFADSSTSVVRGLPKVPEEVSNEFARASEAILIALEGLNTFVQTRDAARTAFSRLLGALGKRILPELPRWFGGLLIPSSSKDEIASFLRLLVNVIHKLNAEIYSFLNSLFTPLMQRVFAGIAEPILGTDDEIQLVELKTHYLAFLQVVLSEGLSDILVSVENQAVFENIVSSIEHFTRDPEDFLTAKIAFQVLTKMCSVWGGPDVQLDGGQPQPTLTGFDRFMLERFSGLVWALPSETSVDPRDARARQVLMEGAGMQKQIFSKTGQEYVTWLRERELGPMGMDEGRVNAYLNALTTSDAKGFKKFFWVSTSRPAILIFNGD